MIRRSVLAVGALIAALTLSSCSSVTSNDDAATVGDVSLDQSTLGQYLVDIEQIRSPGGDTTEVGTDLARSAIGRWIVEELSRQFLAAEGVAITDEDRSAAEAELDRLLAAEREGGVSDSTREVMVDGIAAQMVFQNTQDPGSLGPFAESVDVTVDSRYGYWDGESGTVVGFG